MRGWTSLFVVLMAASVAAADANSRAFSFTRLNYFRNVASGVTDPPRPSFTPRPVPSGNVTGFGRSHHSGGQSAITSMPFQASPTRSTRAVQRPPAQFMRIPGGVAPTQGALSPSAPPPQMGSRGGRPNLPSRPGFGGGGLRR